MEMASCHAVSPPDAELCSDFSPLLLDTFIIRSFTSYVHPHRAMVSRLQHFFAFWP